MPVEVRVNDVYGPFVRAILRRSQNTVNIMDYRDKVIDPGLPTEDWQPAIQQAINDVAAKQTGTGGWEANVVGTVEFPIGIFKIRKPLVTPIKGITLRGEAVSNWFPDDEWYGQLYMQHSTVIYKTTNTVLATAPSRTSRNGARTDVYNDKDAVIMVDHGDDDYNMNTTIQNMVLRSDQANSYGIFAPRCARLKVRNVFMHKIKYGFTTYDTWMSEFSNVTIRECIEAFRWVNDGSFNGTGTTVTFTNCFAETAEVGFQLNLLNYSSMNNCAADHIKSGVGRAYNLVACNGITMNGCGAEDTLNADLIYVNNSFVTVNGFGTYQIGFANTGTRAQIVVDTGGKAVFNTCQFTDYIGTANTANTFNVIVQNGGRAVFSHCSLPTNGNTWISYSGGASATYIDDKGVTIADANGVGGKYNGIRRYTATAQPTTGTWTKGDLVENTNPTVAGTAGSRYIVTGWMRLTTGSAHVAGTDWSEMRVLSGT